MAAASYFIGIDGGGTATKLYAAPANRVWAATRTGAPAHLKHASPEAVAEVLVDLVAGVMHHRGRAACLGICLAVAGAGRQQDREGLRTAMAARAGASLPRFTIVSDAEAAFAGAFGDAGGLLVLAGTGSMVLARTAAGVWLRTGGWGYRLGDDGSGYEIGRLGLRAVARAFEGGTPTRLQQLIEEAYACSGVQDLIRALYDDQVRLPDVAPLVLHAAETGDGAAMNIVHHQTEKLAAHAARLATRAGDVPRRLALCGGLTGLAYFTETMRAALVRSVPGWPVVTPRASAAEGAWMLAQRTS